MFDHILVPLDGSILAECVLPHVLAFAQTFCSKVTILNVLDRESAYGSMNVVNPLDWAIRKAIAETYQQGVSDRLSKAGLQISSAITEGRAAEAIINYAHEHKVDLIALSTHGLSGLSGWNISSIVQKVIYRAYTSLLIIPAYQQVQMDLAGFRYQKVFVGLDGSRRAEWVLPEALELAAFHHALLLLAHVISKPEIPSYMPLIEEETELLNRIIERNYRYAEIYLQDLCSRLSTDIVNIKAYQLISENPIEALRELAEQERVDLVVLNAHGHSGCYKRLYGSVTLSFITYGATPLLILQDLYRGMINPTQAEMAAFTKPKRVISRMS
jgi:nucleotide-binding universal stress UspA family protein